MKSIPLDEKLWSIHSDTPEPAGLRLKSNIQPVSCAFLCATMAVELTSRYCNPAAMGTGGCLACVSEHRELVRNSESSVTAEPERKWSFASLGASLSSHVPRARRSNGLRVCTGDMRRKPCQRPNSEQDKSRISMKNAETKGAGKSTRTSVSAPKGATKPAVNPAARAPKGSLRSEEHTSELQ